MKVLLIDVNCKSSSTGKIVYDLYTGVNAAGDEAAVCYGRGPLVEGRNIYKFGMDWETCIHALLTRITGYTGCFSNFSTRRLLRFIDEFRPDVVHIHELHAYFVNLSGLLRYLAANNIPIVWTFHCEFMYTGKCGHALECEKWMTGCGGCPLLREYPKTLIFDHSGYMFRQKKSLLSKIEKLTLVTPSKWLAERVSRSFLSDRELTVIHNGIDTEIFHPRDAGALRERLRLANGEKVVLAVAPGIMDERKGGKWVLELAEMMQGENARFILIGADNAAVPKPDNVIILPRTSDQLELAEFYSLADVFVICSRRENFPTTCIEAQCCGTPVCGFDTGGTAETVLDKTGRLSEYGDIDVLAGIVRTLLSSGAACDAAAAQRAFGKREMISNYYLLYNKVTGRENNE